MPVDPGPSPWQLPSPEELAGCDDLVALGADLAPATLLAAYRGGLFPMPLDPAPDRGAELGWWSPQQRGVLPLDGLRVSRSLRRSLRRYEVRVDTAFHAVVMACADPTRPFGWISEAIQDAYGELHELGWAHSVEAWTVGPDGDRLVGGLYGVAVDGLFAGESMFALERDASKVALVALVDLLREDGEPDRLLDVQWSTPHLASLGVVELPRTDYLQRLDRALQLPLPPVFSQPFTPSS